MKIASSEWVNTLSWEVCHPASLILEDPEEYRAAVADLSAQNEGEGGKLVFSQDGEILSLSSDGLLIRDLWAVDINQKKLLSGVQKQLLKIGQEEYYGEISDLINGLDALMEGLSQDTMLPLLWDRPENLAPFLKCVSLRLESSEDPFERLVDLVRLYREFLKTRFVILVGIRAFLSREECMALCRDFTNYAVPVLFVDPETRWRLPDERQLILDRDHCELLLP